MPERACVCVCVCCGRGSEQCRKRAFVCVCVCVRGSLSGLLKAKAAHLLSTQGCPTHRVYYTPLGPHRLPRLLK